MEIGVLTGWLWGLQGWRIDLEPRIPYAGRRLLMISQDCLDVTWLYEYLKIVFGKIQIEYTVYIFC